jgi:hypothetical protein
MIYEYTIFSNDLLIKGRADLVEDLSPTQATQRIAQYGAHIAEAMHAKWDPFNVTIAIHPQKRKPRRRAPNK